MTNDLPEPQAEPLSPNEQDSLRQAAEDAIFAGMAPTDAEMRLSDQYQALQQHDDLTESVLAHKDAYRARELGSNNLTSQQAAALIAEGRHMQPRAKAYFNYAQKAREQYLRRAQDHAFVAEIVQRVNGTADQQASEAQAVETQDVTSSLQPTAAPQAVETQNSANAILQQDTTSKTVKTQDLTPSVQPTAASQDVETQNSTNAILQQDTASQTVKTQDLTLSVQPTAIPQASEAQGSLPHANSTTTPVSEASEDEEPQGGLGPNFQRTKRDALLGVAPSARRINPVLSLLSTPAPFATATAHAQSAMSATPAQPVTRTETAQATPTPSVASQTTEADKPSPQATAPAPSKLLPPDFATQALNLEACRKLVAPVLVQVRAAQDKVLGARFAHMREAAYSFYQLEEDIFGTGFESGEQRTHLMLEFLTVLASQNQADPFAVEQCDKFGRFAFLKRHNLILRQILFNNPELGIIAATTQQDEVKWQQWFEQFSAKLQTPPKGRSEDSIPYSPDFLAALLTQLKQVCLGEFERFVTLVKVLRSWSIDTDKNHQWPTLFLFPFGYDSLFWESDITTNFNINLMGGSGQNVFSMLARAQSADTDASLGSRLVERFFVDHNGLNTGACYLSGTLLPGFEQEQEVAEQRLQHQIQVATSFEQRIDLSIQRIRIATTRYLPYRDLPRYHLLREDFEALCRLDLTKQELFLALGSLGSLHQICYLLEQEKLVLELPRDCVRSCDLNMVVVANPELKNGVRVLSMRRLKENIALFAQARTHYVKAHLRAVVAACAPVLLTKPLLTVTEQKLVCNLMRCAFDFNPRVRINLLERTITQLTSKDDPNAECIIVVPDGISYAEIEAVLIDNERDMHIQSLHSTWSSDIGLTTKESAVSYFYSISDELLYYLVLALVPKGRPIALKDFLTKLYERYHLVIGLNEAGSYAVENADFIANERQFKLKLIRNHLLVSLSDACDYVRNPFS